VCVLLDLERRWEEGAIRGQKYSRALRENVNVYSPTPMCQWSFAQCSHKSALRPTMARQHLAMFAGNDIRLLLSSTRLDIHTRYFYFDASRIFDSILNLVRQYELERKYSPLHHPTSVLILQNMSQVCSLFNSSGAKLYLTAL
jgi:hypothetical protein